MLKVGLTRELLPLVENRLRFVTVADNLNRMVNRHRPFAVCCYVMKLRGMWGRCMEGTEASLHSFLASAVGAEWSASRPSGFTHWDNSSWYRLKSLMKEGPIKHFLNIGRNP
jgi:hypothetical protein